MRKILLVGATIGGLAIAGPLVAQPIDSGSATETTTPAANCGNGNSLVAVHPTLLWPPNHKYYGDGAGEDLYFLATDAQNGQIALSTNGLHDQYDSDGAEFNGSGNTGDQDNDGIADDVKANDGDAELDGDESTSINPVYTESGTGSVRTDWVARAERAGTGVRLGVPNRTYTLTGTATFTDGTCSVSVDIVVPHDMGVGDGNGKKEPVR